MRRHGVRHLVSVPITRGRLGSWSAWPVIVRRMMRLPGAVARLDRRPRSPGLISASFPVRHDDEGLQMLLAERAANSLSSRPVVPGTGLGGNEPHAAKPACIALTVRFPTSTRSVVVTTDGRGLPLPAWPEPGQSRSFRRQTSQWNWCSQDERRRECHDSVLKYYFGTISHRDIRIDCCVISRSIIQLLVEGASGGADAAGTRARSRSYVPIVRICPSHGMLNAAKRLSCVTACGKHFGLLGDQFIFSPRRDCG